jgi:hypothetical protein
MPIEITKSAPLLWPSIGAGKNTDFYAFVQLQTGWLDFSADERARDLAGGFFCLVHSGNEKISHRDIFKAKKQYSGRSNTATPLKKEIMLPISGYWYVQFFPERD